MACPKLDTAEESLSFPLKRHCPGALSWPLPRLSDFIFPVAIADVADARTRSCCPAFVNIKAGFLGLQSHVLGSSFPRQRMSHPQQALCRGQAAGNREVCPVYLYNKHLLPEDALGKTCHEPPEVSLEQECEGLARSFLWICLWREMMTNSGTKHLCNTCGSREGASETSRRWFIRIRQVSTTNRGWEDTRPAVTRSRGPRAGFSHRAEWGGIRVGPRGLGLFIFRYFSASKSPSPQVLLPSCPLTGSEMDTLPIAQLLWQVGTSEAEWTVLYPERPLPGRAPACLP